MAESSLSPSKKLTVDEIKNIASYVKSCEVDQVQLQHYEKNYADCSRQLDRETDRLNKSVIYILLLGIGYYAGSRN